MLEARTGSDFGFLQILECLHIPNGILGMGLKSKHEMHLFHINLVYTQSLKVTLCPFFRAPAFWLWLVTWGQVNFSLVALYWYSGSVGFGAVLTRDALPGLAILVKRGSASSAVWSSGEWPCAPVWQLEIRGTGCCFLAFGVFSFITEILVTPISYSNNSSLRFISEYLTREMCWFLTSSCGLFKCGQRRVWGGSRQQPVQSRPLAALPSSVCEFTACLQQVRALWPTAVTSTHLESWGGRLSSAQQLALLRSDGALPLPGCSV